MAVAVLIPDLSIGAEVFAAEFLFPEEEFHDFAAGFITRGIVTPEAVVHMNYYSPAIVSYQFLVKTLTRLGYVKKRQFANVKFTKLHTELYGSHHYHSRRR